MAAGKYSFVIEKGATTDFEILYKDASGTPIDLTDNQARMQLRAEQTGSSELYLTLSSSLNNDGTGLNISGSGGTNPPESGSIGIFISYLTSSTLDSPLPVNSHNTRIILYYGPLEENQKFDFDCYQSIQWYKRRMEDS